MAQTGHDFAAAYPRKRFFIEMFTRDIALEDCILDLIDNAIDSLIRTRELDLGADVVADRKSRQKADISVKISPKAITVSDGCGGISVPKAREEIFNFGHSRKGASALTSLGLGAYGIGLKRAIFKMGSHFRLDSSEGGSGFRVEENIDEWIQRDETIEQWRFPLQVLPLSKLDCEANGTTITVSHLYPSINELAGNDAFIDTLRRSVARAYSLFLSRYVNVEINSDPVEPLPIPMGTAGEGYEPAVSHYRDDGVDVYVKAGLAARGPKGEWQSERAGWYVLCNGRIVISADKSELTGWGAGILPTFHSSKARGFIGFVNFTSNDPLKLPWTTTKRGLNRESPVFLRARNKMQSVARSVYSYLDSLYASGDDRSPDEREASKSVSQASAKAMMSGTSSSFKAPRTRRRSSKVSVQFSADRSTIESIKEHLGRQRMSAGEVGEYALSYLVEQEEIE